MIAGHGHHRLTQVGKRRNHVGFVLRPDLGQVADEEDRLAGGVLLEARKDEAVRVQVGRDEERARRRQSLALSAAAIRVVRPSSARS